MVVGSLLIIEVGGFVGNYMGDVDFLYCYEIVVVNLKIYV